MSLRTLIRYLTDVTVPFDMVVRNIVKKWKLFRKYKLEFRGRVKYNISFAIREIYEFLRLSRDEAALA
jgi:hypothetical protein